MQVLSNDFGRGPGVSAGINQQGRSVSAGTYPLPYGRGLLWCLCLTLLVLWLASGPAAEAAQPADANNPGQQRSQTRDLSKTLEGLIRQLRELRSDYYLRKANDEAKLQTASRNSDLLEAELEELRRQQADLDRLIQQYKSESQDLRDQLASRAALQAAVRRHSHAFHSAQKAAIENVAPYKQPDRIERLEAACQDVNDANAVSIAEQLGRIWSYVQEEMRLARSSETYSAQAPSDDGASPHARYFRVGQLILGYDTEDNRRAGMWLNLPDGKGWVSFTDPKQAAQVRDAVEILDRRQGPKLLMLPVVMRSSHAPGGETR
jgi:FtsZ-binding cell division protein ZapB